MKSKTLIAITVASTLGCSAAAFAGSSHHAVMPSSPNESGENVFSYQNGFGPHDLSSPVGAMSDSGTGMVSGSYRSGPSNFSSNADDSAAIGSDESLAAADEGPYSDTYVVSLIPRSNSWDDYAIDDRDSSDMTAASDVYLWMPTQEQVVLIPSASTSDEMVYELALIPMTSSDGSGLSTGMTDDLSGE
jgi:hypothetical protein